MAGQQELLDLQRQQIEVLEAKLNLYQQQNSQMALEAQSHMPPTAMSNTAREQQLWHDGVQSDVRMQAGVAKARACAGGRRGAVGGAKPLQQKFWGVCGGFAPQQNFDGSSPTPSKFFLSFF